MRDPNILWPNAMAVAFRASSPADVEALKEVWRSSVEATHHFLSPEDLRDIAEES